MDRIIGLRTRHVNGRIGRLVAWYNRLGFCFVAYDDGDVCRHECRLVAIL